MITVNVNQKAHQIAAQASVEDLVSSLNISSRGIAIAINNKVVKKSDWNIQQLQDNDAVLIITSTQGG